MKNSQKRSLRPFHGMGIRACHGASDFLTDACDSRRGEGSPKERSPEERGIGTLEEAVKMGHSKNIKRKRNISNFR